MCPLNPVGNKRTELTLKKITLARNAGGFENIPNKFMKEPEKAKNLRQLTNEDISEPCSRKALEQGCNSRDSNTSTEIIPIVDGDY